MTKQEELEQQLIEQMTQQHEFDSIEPTDPNFLLYSPKPVGYNTTNEQRYIFSNLVSGFDGTTITDIGCGRADLYDHLNATTGVISYNGIDHNPSMTQLAKQRYNIDCITDAFENIEIPKAKWIVACSLFTQRRCETEDADLIKMFEDVDKMYEAADSVVAFNLLSPINNNIVEGFFYAHPGLVLDMLIEKYKNVSIRHNYSEFLYTVTIYKF